MKLLIQQEVELVSGNGVFVPPLSIETIGCAIGGAMGAEGGPIGGAFGCMVGGAAANIIASGQANSSISYMDYGIGVGPF